MRSITGQLPIISREDPIWPSCVTVVGYGTQRVPQPCLQLPTVVLAMLGCLALQVVGVSCVSLFGHIRSMNALHLVPQVAFP
jgi:hypothetical protein